MTRQQAQAIATVLGNAEPSFDSIIGEWGVEWARPDGRYVRIDDDAAARYHDRRAHDVGDNPSHEVHAEEWGLWGDGRYWADRLADVLGGTAHHTGGGYWCVLVDRADGRCAYIGDESAAIYASREAFHNGPVEDAEHFDYLDQPIRRIII